jgi:hypothetical protein
MTLESQLAAAFQQAWNDGCPVAGSSPEAWAEMAALARRRWSSFSRRNANKEGNRASRVEDLAKGLCEKYERGGLRMAGPLVSDYRWLAAHVAKTLEAECHENS